MAENIATLPYASLDEPLFVIHTAAQILACTGADALLALKELFPEHVVDSDDEGDDTARQPRVPAFRTSCTAAEIARACGAASSSAMLAALKQHLQRVHGLTAARCAAYCPEDATKAAAAAVDAAPPLLPAAAMPDTAWTASSARQLYRDLHRLLMDDDEGLGGMPGGCARRTSTGDDALADHALGAEGIATPAPRVRGRQQRRAQHQRSRRPRPSAGAARSRAQARRKRTDLPGSSSMPASASASPSPSPSASPTPLRRSTRVRRTRFTLNTASTEDSDTDSDVWITKTRRAGGRVADESDDEYVEGGDEEGSDDDNDDSGGEAAGSGGADDASIDGNP